MSTPSPSAENDEVYKQFQDQVNLTATELEKWLATDESQTVGQDSGDGESIGHQSGKHIVRILRKSKAELTEQDYAHMHKVHSYISRHTAQGPKDDVEHSRWRYSLMNWGHDPLK